ncbi:uncharacterized protein METZ01_LOCUS467226, partial [marine metagenome]
MLSLIPYKLGHKQNGSVAPLAMLFAFLSMLITLSYLSSSVSVSTREKYRFGELRAAYIAEAGLNREAADYLPTLNTEEFNNNLEHILVGSEGVDFGKDPYGNPLGKYKDVKCYVEENEENHLKQYVGRSTGEVRYSSINGDDIVIQKTAEMAIANAGFERYMYFTNDESAFGPNVYPPGVVRFGQFDKLEGWVSTNSQVLRFSQYGCPDVDDLISLEITENMTNIEWAGCENLFEDKLDTV